MSINSNLIATSLMGSNNLILVNHSKMLINNNLLILDNQGITNTDKIMGSRTHNNSQTNRNSQNQINQINHSSHKINMEAITILTKNPILKIQISLLTSNLKTTQVTLEVPSNLKITIPSKNQEIQIILALLSNNLKVLALLKAQNQEKVL